MSKTIQGVKAIIESSIYKDKYLLAQHNIKDLSIRGRWTFLGGCIDENDKSYEHTLTRELKEELNLLVDIEKEIGIFEYKPKQRMYLVFLATAINEPIICSDEILNIDWFTYAQIQNMHNNNLLQTGFEIEAFRLMSQNHVK